LWPHQIAGEGHFIALLRNDSRPDLSAAASPWTLPVGGVRRLLASGGRGGQPRAGATHGFVAAGPAEIVAWHVFEGEALHGRLPTERLLRHGDQLYLAPEGLPDLGSLRVVRLGLWLGTLKPGRFEPAHALALALMREEVRQSVALTGDDVLRYLHGEALRLDASGPDGWTLITVDGWPLGWGRRVAEVIKNFYPKGLRWPA
jgi:NOL1/NOP2/fmu family ribosome biogenesis protein